jgi:tetratricopeptide (TPR) repeat protein
MDYKVEEHEDGSRTIWISDTEQKHRLSILVGYTIYPNSSLLEMTIKPLNKTPIASSFLFWSNPAVHCDSSYQVIFPSSVQYVAGHFKNEITSWPIADSRINNYDFAGIDVSWWKNTHVPVSFFAWNVKDDYYGGYDFNKNAGTVYVGNHHISPGLKYWTDGNNPAGFRINQGLTDNSGRYIELMTGFYTDNQPDLSWLQPYETKLGTKVWFPVRNLEGLKYANRNGAINLEVTDDRIIKVRLNTTSPHKDASLVLKIVNDQILLQKSISISPSEPFNADIPLPLGLTEEALEITLIDRNGNILIYYKPSEHYPEEHKKPETLKPFPSPEEVKTIEELYLIGLRLNQFYNANVDPMPYYNEALKRDSGEYRINTQLGLLSIKDHNWVKAEKYLRKAVERITMNYTRPKDCEALYYLALALRAQNSLDEAYDYFYRASWSNAWHTASYYQLAEIDCMRGDYLVALDHLDRSIITNSDNLQALNLKAIVFRKLNDLVSAKKQAQSILETFKIDHQALNELYLVNKECGDEQLATKNLEELTLVMRDQVQSYLELATSYSNCGFYEEALELLSRLEKKGSEFPMVYYYIGYFYSKLDEPDKALQYYKKASQMPHMYCFPFRAEEVNILKDAMAINPADARAPYYLGNLLYEHQPEQAITEWEKSSQLDNSFYIVHRNLGLAYKEIKKDFPKALVSLENAVALNKEDPRLLFEVDVLYELNKFSPLKKYEFLKKNFATVKKRSDALLRLATRAVEFGEYDEAINLLTTNKINELEGAQERQDAFLNAHLLRSLEYMKKMNYEKALKDLETASAYPIGLYGRARYAQFNYIMGLIQKKSGNGAVADTLFQKALAININSEGRDREYLYYRGMALNMLGRTEESRKLFNDMLEIALNRRNESESFSVYGEVLTRELQIASNHFLAGLAYEGLGEKEKAKVEFTNVLKINPGHVWSKVHLESINN